MEITVSQERGRMPVTVLHVDGNLDAATAPQFQRRAEALIRQGDRNLLIDLAEVPYMSSAGLRALNALYDRLRTDAPGESHEAEVQGVRTGQFKSPHLKLLNPSRRVLEALSMAGFDMFLDIYHELKQAVDSF